MLPGHCPQHILVQQIAVIRDGQCSASRFWQAIIETICQRAGIPMTCIVRMFTSLISRCQFYYPQSQLLPFMPEQEQRIERQFTAGSFGCEEKDLVQFLVGTSVKKGK